MDNEEFIHFPFGVSKSVPTVLESMVRRISWGFPYVENGVPNQSGKRWMRDGRDVQGVRDDASNGTHPNLRLKLFNVEDFTLMGS